MAEWVAVGQFSEFFRSSPPIPPTATPQATPPVSVSPSAHYGQLSSVQKFRRIYFIVCSGFAVLSVALPWSFVFVSGGGEFNINGVIIGFMFWESIICMILGLAGLAAAIVDLAVSNPIIVSRIKWGHLGLYIGLLLFSALGIILPMAKANAEFESNHDIAGISVFVIPIASAVLLGLTIAALVMAIRECQTRR